MAIGDCLSKFMPPRKDEGGGLSPSGSLDVNSRQDLVDMIRQSIYSTTV